MTYQTPEVLRYQGRQYDMESDPLNAYFLAGGHNPGFHGASWRGYKGTWEILDGRLYLTTLIGDLKDSTQVGLLAVFPNVSERVFADWYTGAIKCPLGIGHEVTNGCFDHPAHLIIYVEAGLVHDVKEVPNPKFGDYFKFSKDTPETKDESFLIVNEDHMVLHYRHSTSLGYRRKEAPLLSSLSLPVFTDFVLRFKKNCLYMREVEQIRMSKTSDYEGIPFEDQFSFFFDGDRNDAKTMLFVTFHGCWTETDYDYIGKTRADRSTAYKHKTGPEGETKFKIHTAQLIRRLGGGQSWFIAEIQRLRLLLDRLDAATHTLQSWADSGLSMRVSCPNNFLCSRAGEPSDITAERLSVFAKKGWSIDQLKQKLKCRECGSAASELLLVPRTDTAISASDRG